MSEHKTCEERIDNELEREIAILRDLWTFYQEDCEAYHPEHETNMYEYGLAFDYVEPGTFDNTQGYWRYQLSWGGPSDEFRFFDEGHDGTRVEYVFLDWFDGAKRHLRGTDRDLMLEIYDWHEPE